MREEKVGKKERRDRKENAGKVGNQRSKFWLVSSIFLGGILLFGLVFFLPKNEPWGLPATPRNSRPVTLSPDLFSGKVREAYRIAKMAPELLEHTPCYCGCYVSDRHQNNLDCYTDRHAVG